jgi:myosin V
VQSLPYTRTGDIVIAVNPYKWFDDLYTPQIRHKYADALVWNRIQDANGDPRALLAPHVYEASSLAYRGLAAQGENQSILVSGESGAGKTETVKILMGAIASVQRGRSPVKKSSRDSSGSTNSSSSSPAKTYQQQQQQQDDSPIVQRVLDSNPLLEAFGNAKTLRNDNSSRFGKYIQLQFDSAGKSDYASQSVPPCLLAGSKCEVYLLEKSRVISHASGERSFHIFYQLLAAPESVKTQIWSGLADTDMESFDYVGFTETDMIEGLTDEAHWDHTIQSLALVGVVGDKLQTLLRTICIVLQLGNIDFEPIDADHSKISSPEEFEDLAELMGVHPAALNTALTIRNVEARGEIFPVPLTAERAKEGTDAFAKEIYAKTFLWLVRTINDATCAEKNYDPSSLTSTSSLLSSSRRPGLSRRKSSMEDKEFGMIGLLDIFGFETFEVNRFEQLCINYANEKLQQKFTQDIFRSVQTEYEFEGIELGEIRYDDNTDVLDLIEGRMGLLAFLNEECFRPKGSDKTFVFKAQAMNKDNPCFFRLAHDKDTEFGIVHYAGKVMYDATNFVTKNTDTLPTDLQDCAKISSNDILAKELSNDTMMNIVNTILPVTGEVEEAEAIPVVKKKKRRDKKSGGDSGGSVVLTHPHSPPLQRRQSNIIALTVWSKFKHQLSDLMSSLSDTRTRYIRCIKPNTRKRPLLMEHVSTVEQLRCAGVVAAVTISRSAFPNRLDHEVVLDRFKSLWPKGGDHLLQHGGESDKGDNDTTEMDKIRKSVDLLLALALKALEYARGGVMIRAFVIGKSRAYFRAGALEYLEGERLKYLFSWATEIQRVVRGFVRRSQYVRVRTMAICLQSYQRQRIATRRYQKLKSAAVGVQCWFRVVLAQRTLVYLRRNYRSTKIQTRWRIFVARRRLLACVAASVPIQAMVRGAVQRPKYRQALIDKKEESKLENQLRTLQRKLEEAEQRRHQAEKDAEERAARVLREHQEKEAAEKRRQEEEHQRKLDEAAAAAEEEQARLEAEEAARLEEERKQRERDAIAEKEGLKKQLEEQKREQQEIQQQLTAEQQLLMDESGRMLEYLRKEVFKLRNQNAQLKTDFDLLKDNNQRLMDANASAGASFAALNQHTKQLGKQNVKLQEDVGLFRGQVQKLNVLQVELKEELKMKQATYIAEVHSRLQYQKALGKITDLVQEQCRDHRLVERVLEVVDQCEMEYQSGEGPNLSAPPPAPAEAPETSRSSSLLGSILPSIFG